MAATVAADADLTADDVAGLRPVVQQVVVYNEEELCEWAAQMERAIMALLDWTATCGHRSEAVKAIRALRVCMAAVARDMNGGES